jgi:hypothetical protein
MNGALASPGPRRSAAPESASRSRPEPATRAPVRQLPVARMPSVGQAEVPSTRDRLQTSFGAAPALAGDGNGEAIRAPAPVGAQDLVQAAAPEPVLPAAPPSPDRPTTRDRIVNRAAAPTAEQEPAEAAPERAAVVDLSEERDRRRQRPEVVTPSAPEAPLAPVLVLVPEPGAGAALARPDVVATGAPARAPPAPRPEESGAPIGAGPEAEGAPIGAGPELAPEAAAAREPSPVTAPEAGAAATPEGPAAAPSAAPPGAEAVGAPAAEPPAAEPAPAAARAVAPSEQPAAPEGAAAPAPVLRVIRNPEEEPGFQAMKERTRLAAVRTKRHQPGREGAETAQGASQPDKQKDVDSQAATDHVEAMGEQEPGPFDAAKFKLDVKAKVESMAPPATLEEADEFENSGKAGQATSWLQQLVAGGKAASENDIKVTTQAPADPEGKEPKPVSEMVNDAPGPPLPDVGAAAALPGQRPPAEIDVSAGPLEVEAKMTEGNVTEEQLASANEPSFIAVLDARQEVREHAAIDPGTYHTHEERVLAGGRVEAENVAATQLEGMHAGRVDTLSNVLGAKNETKTADQQLRDDVHQTILDIHERTRADVTTILETLDKTVDDIFTSSEKAARDHFEEYVAQKMSEYKADRYSGVFGGARWAKDKIFDLPDEVNEFYRQGREDYLAAMDRALDVIASVVGMLLGAAQLRIQGGREEVRTFVEGLDGSVRKLGEDTAADLDNGFDQLSSDVDAKRDELVDAVAHKYVEARDDLDSRIKELQEANKGLVSKAIDAVVGVIKTIYELTKLLLRVLLKAASAIGDIVAHPIRFLESLVGAVKGGLERFIERFPTHLQESLVDLLFGELGKTGITMPKELNFAGIVDLVLQVLGLTYSNIRERVVKRFGEEAVAKMEEKVDVFRTLLKDGVGGLWTWIQQKLTDLEDLVIGKIKEYIEERVVRAGIGYIIALLNPAATFIKACQGIYQIVMFIVERAKQIADFVDAVLDSISAIAQGNIGAAVEKIDNALAGALTLAIGFLARLAGLGALSEKMRSIIAVVRKPITRVVDQVVFGAAQIYGRAIGPAIAFGKAKVKSGKEFLKGKSQAVQDRIMRGPEVAEATPPGKIAEGPEAPATEPLPDAAAAGPLVIHEPFRIEGHEHEIYTGEDGKQLILSSNGPTPITALGDPALTRLHGQYVAARATYDSALALLAANPHSRPGIGAARKNINRIIRDIVRELRRLRPDDSPGASAPGIGDKGRHGEKRTSVRFGPPLWHLESEHVIPFSVGKRLWDAAGEAIPRRGRAADRRQTTIMIYEGAARRKTDDHDEALWNDFRAMYETHLRPKVRGLQTLLVMAQDRGGADQTMRNHVDELLEEFKRRLLEAGASAVEATDQAVHGEHANTTDGGPTNGARRAEPSALPTKAQIQTTAAEQLIDVHRLVSDDVERGIGR